MDSRCAIMGTCKSTPLEIYHAARIKQKHRSKPRLPPVLCHRCSFYQFGDDMLAQQQSSRGRDPHERTGNTSPSGGRSLQLLRFHRFLRAEHDGVVSQAALPQLPPQPEQPAHPPFFRARRALRRASTPHSATSASSTQSIQFTAAALPQRKRCTPPATPLRIAAAPRPPF